MRKSVIALGFLISVFAFAAETGANYSKRMDCTLLVPASGLPAIPKYQFEIGRDLSNQSFILKLNALRPVGVPARYEAMRPLGSEGNTDVFKTEEATAVIVNGQNSQSAHLLTPSSLVYQCQSEKQMCASGSYDAATDRCVFPNSVIPLP